MTAQVLDGRALSRSLNKALKARVEQRLDEAGRPPGLAVVLVGEDPASEVYVRRKGVVAGRIGFHHVQHNLDASVSQATVEELVRALNDDPAIDGILVQMPLPKHLDARAILETVQPSKDVDGFTMMNTGRLGQGVPGHVACTPRGVMHLLELSGVNPEGREAVVVGRSNIVGRPMAMLLEQANATVTVCHSRTKDLEHHVRRAEILVAAVGRPEMVRGEWIRPDAVVLDVGINRLADGRLVGDVATAEAAKAAAWVTPVPGGVGPMTIAMLMQNTFDAWCLHTT